jgi:release factor glutamine methyltransferase
VTPQEAARRGWPRPGVPDPQRDARRLWDWALCIKPTGEDPHPRSPFAAGPSTPCARRGCRSRASSGRRAFWKHDFEITDAVLDPRPDTETLVEIALGAPFATVLDLGTGSGCILLSLLAERPGATGLGTDISEAALRSRARERRAAGVATGGEFRRSDWFAGSRDAST